MKYRFLLVPLILLSCSKKQEEDIVIFSSEADSALAKIQSADSVYSVRHSGYRGMHMHGNKNAAVHAHQNLDKKKRILRTEAQKFKARKEAAQKQNEIMTQRMREKSGVPTDSSKSTDSTNTP